MLLCHQWLADGWSMFFFLRVFHLPLSFFSGFFLSYNILICCGYWHTRKCAIHFTFADRNINSSKLFRFQKQFSCPTTYVSHRFPLPFPLLFSPWSLLISISFVWLHSGLPPYIYPDYMMTKNIICISTSSPALKPHTHILWIRRNFSFSFFFSSSPLSSPVFF